MGGGPAGLKAAEIAARRGHAVTLVERAPELGGRLRLVRKLGVAAELYHAVEWLEAELADLGVDVRLETEADEELVRDGDTVILATGSRPDPERIGPTDGSIPLLSIDAAVVDPPAGDDVLLVDLRGDLETALTAERLAAAGANVTITTPWLSNFPHLGFTHTKDVLDRLYGFGCALEPSTVFAGIAGGEVTTRHVYSREQRRRRFNAVVGGVPGWAELSLVPLVEAAGKELVVAGDAVAPRTAMHAFREGDHAGRAV